MQSTLDKILRAYEIKGITSAMITRGLIEYLQAGDIEIYKFIKDEISTLIGSGNNEGLLNLLVE